MPSPWASTGSPSNRCRTNRFSTWPDLPRSCSPLQVSRRCSKPARDVVTGNPGSAPLGGSRPKRGHARSGAGSSRSVRQDHRRAVQPEEAARLRAWLVENWPLRPRAHSLCCAVSRPGHVEEIFGIRWAGIDFERGTVSFVEQAVRPKTGPVKLAQLKTLESERTISVSPLLLDQLRLHRGGRRSPRPLPRGRPTEDPDKLNDFVARHLPWETEIGLDRKPTAAPPPPHPCLSPAPCRRDDHQRLRAVRSLGLDHHPGGLRPCREGEPAQHGLARGWAAEFSADSGARNPGDASPENG